MERLLNKTVLITFGLFTLLFHASVSLLQYFIDINGLLIVDYIILGLIAIGAILYFGKQQIPIRFQPAQVLLILFIIWNILSCISMSIKYNNDWVDYNGPSMLSTAVSLLLAFPLGYVLIREEKNTVGNIILHILLVSWTIFIAYVLISVFQGQKIITPNGGVIRMTKRSLQLNCNRNTTGALEMLFLLGCVLMAFRSKRHSVRLFYGLSSVIHYVALTLSNSRASIYATMIGFVALIGFSVYARTEKKPHRLLISIIAALLAGAAFYLLSNPVFRLYSVSSGAKISARSALKDATLHGRTTIWKCAIEGIFTSIRTALFGVTPVSITEMITQMSDGKIQNMYTHNQFLEVAAGIGIPGLCIFLAWFALIIKDIYKLFFIRKDRTLFLAVPVIILTLMLANMVESYLLFYFYFSGFVFFLLCGMLHGRVNEPAKGKQLTRQMRRHKK